MAQTGQILQDILENNKEGNNHINYKYYTHKIHSFIQLKFESSLCTQTGLDMNDRDVSVQMDWDERGGYRIMISGNWHKQEKELKFKTSIC